MDPSGSIDICLQTTGDPSLAYADLDSLAK
jgi:hypothetical protein